MSTDRAASLIAQHAETTRLLGVDFLPLGNAPSAMDREPATPPAEFAPRDAAPEPETAPTQRPPAAIEPKPTPEQGRAHLAAPASDVRSCHEALGDPQAKLDAVRARYIADAPHQHFATSFSNIVFGEGDPSARLMFIGEAPGETEDQTGRPFVGRAGQLLEKMIIAMGLSRESVYICNVLKTRPPNNATPTPDEARLSAPYLIEQIRIVNPEVIVTLGLPATRLLLETGEPMRAMRGQWWPFPPGRDAPGTPMLSPMSDPDLPEIAVMPTYHPAYLLRSYTEENRRKVWSDLRLVIERLGLPANA